VSSAPDQGVVEFERLLDDALSMRTTVRAGGTDALQLAAKVVEFAYAQRPTAAARLAEGLQTLAPALIGRTPGSEIEITDLIADLDFAGHYHILRDLLYYTYNAPDAMEWRFEGREVTVRFADASLPRQFFLVANNWFLTSMEAFTDQTRGERIADLIRGLPEFEETEAGVEAQTLIEEEVDIKLGLYFDVILDKSVSAGRYMFAEFISVYRLLLTKALYHRYHSRINDSHGIIPMPLDQLARDLEESDPSITAGTARQVVEDIAYGREAAHARLDPVYFSLYHLPDGDEILMLPHHFAMWEGIVNFLRLVALRSPQVFLRGFSHQIGQGLVDRLRRAVEAAGFICRTNVSLKKYGADLPDIDLLILSEEPTLGYVVLTCEVKSPLPPRWAKDQLRVLEADSISKAFEQLDRIDSFLHSDAGVRFLFDQLPEQGLPNFDEFAVAVRSLIVTSDNAGAFFSGRRTIIDFRTFERLLSRCDGDMRFVLQALSSIPDWADASLTRTMVEFQVNDRTVAYEGIGTRTLMDFTQSSYRSIGAPESMLRDMLEDGARPLDFLRDRGLLPEG
jgi:hypothetical protein